jgi:GNAT superfamily N-acetyltransferase
MEIRRFSPDDTADVRASMDILNAASATDASWEHPWLEPMYEQMLRFGWDGEPPAAYLGLVDDRPVGTSLLFTSERDNRHLAWVRVAVPPECRRRGYGSVLFGRMAEEAKAAGRTSIGADGWESERTRAFAQRFGLDVRSRAVQRRQHLAEVGPDSLHRLSDEAARAAQDYELVRLRGRTPPEMVDAVVALAAAINDAPTDDLDIEDEVFSPERLEAYETSAEARGQRLYRVLARHRETGDPAGHTVIAVDAHRPSIGHQHDTAVARAHRGHRLGQLLKADMLLWLADAEPQLETVDTWNAESNDHMIAVNEALGYRVMGRELQVQGSL